MDINQQIIRDLKEKVGFNAEVDFLNMCKGVPVVFKGNIKSFTSDGIVFEMRSPDSICLEWEGQTMILHDSFLAAIQGDVRSFDITTGLVELTGFTYVDRGFGKRSMVRVEPKEPIEATISIRDREIACLIVDISLNGFGVRTGKLESGTVNQGDAVTLKTHIQDRDVEMPATVLNVFKDEQHTRIAITFPQDTPSHAIVARYITHRRAEIRQGIMDAYYKSIGEHA
jgi:hypothetical protein